MTPDELHILSILTNLPKIKVKINQTTSIEFITQVGIMQGDCLSAILFILYFSESPKNGTKNIDISSSILINPNMQMTSRMQPQVKLFQNTSKEQHQ